MSLFRRGRYARKPRQFLLRPLCWLLGHRHATVTVKAGTPDQVVYTNGCLRCHAAPPVSEDRGPERRPIAP